MSSRAFCLNTSARQSCSSLPTTWTRPSLLNLRAALNKCLGLEFLRRNYCADIVPGPCYVRPYHLGYRSDFGYSGMCEPDELILLAQLILTEGLLVQCHFVSEASRMSIVLQVPDRCGLGRDRESDDLADQGFDAGCSLQAFAFPSPRTSAPQGCSKVQLPVSFFIWAA